MAKGFPRRVAQPTEETAMIKWLKRRRGECGAMNDHGLPGGQVYVCKLYPGHPRHHYGSLEVENPVAHAILPVMTTKTWGRDD